MKRAVNTTDREVVETEISLAEKTEALADLVRNKRSRVDYDIKGEANQKIIEIAPIWKQVNMISAGLELLNKKLSDVSLSEEDITLEANLQETWKQVRAIRSKSGEVEQQAAKLKDDEILKFDPADPQHWQ